MALATLRLAQPSDPRIGPFEVELADAQISKALAAGKLDRATALVRNAQQSGAVPAKQLASWQSEIAQMQHSAKTQSLTGLFDARLQSGELTSPAGDSAQDYLLKLRALNPTAAATQQAAQALDSAFFAKARQDTLAGNSAGADRWLADARANGASRRSIADFERQLSAAAAQSAQARADHLLSLVRARLAAAELTAPEGDSAASYLNELEQTHPAGAAQASAERDKRRLAAALLGRARQEMRSNEKSAAEADLSQAKSWGASAAAVRAIESTAASSAPTAKPATGPDLAQLAAGLERIRYTPPQYPDSALSERIAGSVTVQFTVDQRGYTRDVRIVKSEPRGVFDRAVMDAVRDWRYRPPKYRGKPIAVPVRTLIRFELPK
jgi:TonB family protein